MYKNIVESIKIDSNAITPIVELVIIGESV